MVRVPTWCSMTDVRAVLEFANVELLLMRCLERRLEDGLDWSYQALVRQLWWVGCRFARWGWVCGRAASLEPMMTAGSALVLRHDAGAYAPIGLRLIPPPHCPGGYDGARGHQAGALER